MTSVSILDLNWSVFYIIVSIQALALFFFFMFGLSISNTGAKGNWIRALVLAAGLTLLNLLPTYIGPFGWFVSIILSIFLLSKVLTQEIFSSVLTFIIVGIIQQIVEFFVHHLS